MKQLQHHLHNNQQDTHLSPSLINYETIDADSTTFIKLTK